MLGLGVTGLSVVRGLAAIDVPTVAAYTHWASVGRFSKWCRPVRFPNIAEGEEAFVARLIELGRSLDRPPLFASYDEAVALVSGHRELLEPWFRINQPGARTIERIISKQGTAELALETGTRAPRTGHPVTLDDVDAICREYRFPCIVKPDDTFSVPMPRGAKNVRAASPGELRRLYEGCPQLLAASVVQEIVLGGDGRILIYAAYLDAASRPLAAYTGRKIRQYPPDYGVTCLGESESLPDVRELGQAFLEGIRYRGLAAVEFARGVDDGQLYFIELNARAYYHNQLFTDCGVNLVAAAYRDLMGEPPRPLPVQRDGVRWLDFQRDLGSYVRTRASGRWTFWGWLKSAARARSFAVYHRADLKPFFFGILQLVGLVFSKLFGWIASPFRRGP